MSRSEGKHEGILAGTDRTTGEIKTIDQVPSGKACNCLCPQCKTALVAKKGEVMTHHFAHEHVPESLRACQETALHETAKIAAAHLITHLYVPERIENYQSTEKLITHSGMSHTHSDSLVVKAVNLERLAGSVEPVVPDISPFRPDARLQTLYGDIFIEIHVTNPVAPDKQMAMRKADLAVLEIDLSKISRAGLSLEEIKRQVADEAPREWVSNGLKTWVKKAQISLDANIRRSEQEKHTALFRQLRDTSMAHIGSTVTLQAIRHKFSDRGIFMIGQVPVENVRCEKGFWLADLLHAPGTVVTSISDEAMINRLFAWYRATRGRKLTVLSIADTTTLYSNEFETVQAIAALLRSNQSRLPQMIYSLRLVDRHYAEHKLESPITPEKLKALGKKAYVDNKIPEDLARELILNDFTDIVVSHSEYGWEAYSQSSIAKRLDGNRPSGGIREQILYRVRYKDPCLVRFVPSISDSLTGDIFGLLSIYKGELYLVEDRIGPIRVYFNRADFWKKGGVLIMADPMRQGAFRLEPSNGFLSELKNAKPESTSENQTEQ